MIIDSERKAALDSERAEIRAKILALSSQDASAQLGELQRRLRDIEDELLRMEFASEVERQSDA